MSDTSHKSSTDSPPGKLNPSAAERGSERRVSPTFIARFWRHGLLIFIVAGWLIHCLPGPPEPQDPAFHDFADQRLFLGIPHFADVTSNLPFLLVGVAGLWLGQRGRLTGAGVARPVFFAGVALVSVGSAYYHWRPDNGSLVWDRLPMTVGFMAMLAALLGESVNEKLGRHLLFPALLIGFSSVLYWHRYDDLRFYRWVQQMPLLVILVLLAFFRSRYSHQWLMLVAMGCYLLAKLSESHDREVLSFTQGVIGGHALKHLLAAACCGVIVEMVRRRKAVAS